MGTANSCTSCFNWGSGKVGARSMATVSSLNNCQAALPATLVTANCKFYSGSAQSTDTTKSLGSNCAYCKKKYLTMTVTGSVEVCNDTAVTGCTAIANAEFTNCVVSTNTTAGTYICKKGYYGSGTTVAGGYPTCTKGSVANCDHAATSTTCHYCKSKFAVSSTGTCAAFTTDSNCQSLYSDSTCASCWAAYYWNVSTCKLAASLMSVAFLAFAAFFN